MITWRSTSGGIMNLYDRDHSSTAFTRQYVGSTEQRTSYFRIDNHAPLHCTQDPHCLTTMLNVAPHISTGVGKCIALKLLALLL